MDGLLQLIIWIIVLLLVLCSIHEVQSIQWWNASDQHALLGFKSAITFDPNNSLANWNYDTSFCQWRGVTCHPHLQLQQYRVVGLNLSYMGLEGFISPLIGNLSALESLDLSVNDLHGHIPPQLGRLSNANVIDLSYNNLQGNLPAQLGLLTHLEILTLGANSLTGTIPSSFGNLTTLVTMDFSINNFTEPIFPEIGQLTQLHLLYLHTNQLSGTIPATIGNLSALTYLELEGNHLSGPIPKEVGRLNQLQILFTYRNQLSGTIPSLIGNLSSLTALDFAENNLRGHIPSELSRLSKLSFLSIFGNTLTGPIPTSLLNCTALMNLALYNNQLSGHILSDIGSKLNNLQSLSLWGNELSGSISKSLGNCSQLQFLYLSRNQLSGVVPMELGKLHLLETIELAYNRLVSGSSLSHSMAFLTALTNCSRLQIIKMSYNYLTGVLPPSIGHLSPKLSILQLGQNRIKGNIPQEIINLRNLTYLDLSHNFLSGYIPSGIRRFSKLERLDLSGNRLEGNLPEEIGQMKNLGLLDISWNKLSGRIPGSLARLKQLRRVFLHHNHFSGEIPNSLKRCMNLELLDLSHNDLVGNIPREVMASLGSLQFYLNMSGNKLQGPLPKEISKIVNAQAIDISGNQLDGMIPEALANCIALEHLNLSHNALDGLIPDALWKLQNLESIDLSFNFLSGTIPTSLRKIKVLRYLNVCFNNLTGRIPEEELFPNSTVTALFRGNDGLCGPKKYFVPPCPERGQHRLSLLAKVMLSVAGVIAIIVCSLTVRILWYQLYSREQFDLSNFMFGRVGYPKFTHHDLAMATNGFNETNLLGMGRFGSVYKGVLRDGKVVAIKVLNLQNEEVQKSFEKECKVLRRSRHRNLVRIIGVCSYPDFKALILEFAANGSLEKHLYPNTNSNEEDVCGFNLGESLNIATDVAHAMEYLHHDCPVQVVHCDLKPSNVLLDANMTALVSDFGISRLAGPANSMDSLSTAFSLRGSIGYIAPEYGLGRNISVKGDVYSYGILLLEMVTKKRPTDAMFVEDLTLQKWVSSAFPHRLADIVDSKLLANVNTEQNKCLASFIYIGLLCTNESPQERPTMRDVGKALEVLKTSLMGGGGGAGAETAINLATTISFLVRSTNTSAGGTEGVSDSQSSTY